MTAIDQSTFRTVLGHFPTGVTVVTAMVDDEPVGMAIGSFFSISLDPPLVGFCAGKTSGTWGQLQQASSFCVNILGEDQEDVCRKFAGPEKFEGVGWHAAGTGAPVLDGVIAWIDCDLETTHDGGDHDIVVGRVRGLDVGAEGAPLVFFRGGYNRLA